MKSTLLGLLCVLALVTVPSTSYGAPPAEEPLPELATSVTVLGYSTASAAPESVRVQLQIGDQPSFATGAQGLTLPDSDELELVGDFLVENGVDEDTIQIDLFSSNIPYGPSNFGSKITFTYAEPSRLSALLKKLRDKMAARRGPTILNAEVVFLVEECAALEEAAMQGALDNARQRAARMAGLLEMTLGWVISVSEDHTSTVALGTTGGCIALDGLASFGMDLFVRGASPLVNTASKVEVGILLKATFALEPVSLE